MTTLWVQSQQALTHFRVEVYVLTAAGKMGIIYSHPMDLSLESPSGSQRFFKKALHLNGVPGSEPAFERQAPFSR